MSLRARFPELARCAMSEARRPRLVLAAVLSLFVGACLLAVDASYGERGTALFHGAFFLQALALLLYGTVRTTNSVLAERAEKTWDIQRLTPLGSFELAAGKLLGAPLFAYILAALMLPWALAGILLSSKIGWVEAFWDYAGLFSIAFLTLSVGLMASAHSSDAAAGSSAGTAGALVGFLALQSLLPLVVLTTGGEGGFKMVYAGRTLPLRAWLCPSALAFGLWAFLSAKWRIGSELLEGGRLWRLPAFLAFLVLYSLGFDKLDVHLSTIAPAFIVFFAAVLNSEGRDHWRRWLAGDADPWRAVPVWIAGCASYAVLALLVVLYGRSSGAGGVFWRYPLLQTCFLVRDCALLQRCRLTDSRRPEVLALVLIGLAYLLPSVLFAAVKARDSAYLFAPVAEAGVGAAANLLPGLLQALLMAGMLVLALKRQRPAQPF